MRVRFSKRLLMLAIVMMVFTYSAYAGPIQMLITDGTTTIVISDNSGLDSNSTVGAITWIGTIGTWNLNVNTGAGSAISGALSMDLNSINNTTAAGNLTVMFSEMGLTPASQGWSMLFGGTLTAPAGSTAAASAFESNTNTFFATTNSIGSIGPFGPGAFSGTISGAVAGVVAPYSLTEILTLHTTGAGQSSSDGNLAPVPEPATLLLFGSGLAGLALWKRRSNAK